VVLPIVAADRPRGDDVPLPAARPLTELDGERGEDNDLAGPLSPVLNTSTVAITAALPREAEPSGDSACC
jgi:hypothetical protein